VDVQIRPYKLEDAATVVEAALESMADLQPWMPWCHPDYSITDSRSWLEIQVSGFAHGAAFEFAIVSADGRFLGGCGLNQIDTVNHRANLGYWVRSTATRRGVATAAVRAIREWAFDATDLIRLEIVIAAENLASHRVAEKAGAIREGTLQRRIMLHGTAHDATMFSFTREVPVDRNAITSPLSICGSPPPSPPST
jgi:ribosomal-protein-serine acetyltransferase